MNITPAVPHDAQGNIKVAVQDQFAKALDLYFTTSAGAVNDLAAGTSEGDKTITLTDATGFVGGTYIEISNAAGQFYFGTQVGAPAGNVVTLDTPIDFAFSIADAVKNLTRNMAVNGLITPVIFSVGPFILPIDVTRLLGYLEDGTAMGDGLFGGMPELIHGVVLRKNNGSLDNIWNAKTNGEIAEVSFDFTYTDKPPANNFGARYRNSYAGQDKHGVSLRLETGTTLEMLIQDDLTGLVKYRQVAQGHIA